ncbi:MAG: hypothetical protein Q9190_006592 [Brigantiaea leucoxantha]
MTETAEPTAKPTATRFRSGGGFLAHEESSEAVESGIFKSRSRARRRVLLDDDDDDDGVYVPEDEDGDKGGGGGGGSNEDHLNDVGVDAEENFTTYAKDTVQRMEKEVEGGEGGGFLPGNDDEDADDNRVQAGGFIPLKKHMTSQSKKPGQEEQEEKDWKSTITTTAIPSNLITSLQRSPSEPAEIYNNNNNNNNNQIPETDDHNLSHPNLTAEELEEAKMLQELYERGDLRESDVDHDISKKDDQEVGSGIENEKQRNPGRNRAMHTTAVDQEEHGVETHEDESEDEERGSLLSEDPSDEDKDPEWLA